MKIVSAAVIVKDGKVFIAQRPADKNPRCNGNFPAANRSPAKR